MRGASWPLRCCWDGVLCTEVAAELRDFFGSCGGSDCYLFLTLRFASVFLWLSFAWLVFFAVVFMQIMGELIFECCSRLINFEFEDKQNVISVRPFHIL